jgi:dTDP-6-deoxy-L-talose 4-dehydrogenase (NAD+)
LLDLGYDVIATDINTERVDKRATACPGNIFAESDPYRAFGEPDALIHMAWRDGFVHNAPSHLEDLPKHFEFLRKMIEGGTKNVSVMGSMHEIGFFEGAITADTPQNPSSLYGISKNTLRQCMETLCKSTPFSLKWLRGYYVCGNDRFNHSIFAKILEKADAGATEFPFTTGTNQYDFISVDDLGMQIALSATQTEIEGIINCCSGKPQALKDVVEAFIERLSLHIKLQYGVFPDRPYDSKIVYGDNTEIKQIIENYLKQDGQAKEQVRALLTRMA